MASILQQEITLIQKTANENISVLFYEVMALQFRCGNTGEIVFIFCIAEGDGNSEIAEITYNSRFD